MGGSSLGHSVEPADGVYWLLGGFHFWGSVKLDAERTSPCGAFVAAEAGSF